MDKLIRELKARKIPQSQESLLTQLRELQDVANAIGLYDAADFIDNETRGKMYTCIMGHLNENPQ